MPSCLKQRRIEFERMVKCILSKSKLDFGRDDNNCDIITPHPSLFRTAVGRHPSIFRKTDKARTTSSCDLGGKSHLNKSLILEHRVG